MNTAVLLTSELVTNAVVHGASGPVVSAAVANGILEIGVSDLNPCLPRLGRSGGTKLDDEAAMAAAGRGMILVDALADEWGTVPIAEGKHVWFRLSAANWSYRTGCHCHADHVDRVRLESGRYALAISGPWDNPVPPSPA
jgi:hypothetical protein